MTEAEKAFDKEYSLLGAQPPRIRKWWTEGFTAGRLAGLRAALEAEPVPDYQTVLDRKIADRWRERIAAKAKGGSA